MPLQHELDNSLTRVERVSGSPSLIRSVMGLPYSHALVADDDPISRGIVSEQLMRLGIQGVRSASSGRQALNALNRDESISLLVTDLKMPDMDGFRLLKELESLGREVDVIVMSALGGKILQAAQTLFNGNTAVRLLGVAEKPVKPQTLKAMFGSSASSMAPPTSQDNPISSALDNGQHHSVLVPVQDIENPNIYWATVENQWTHPSLMQRRSNLIDDEINKSDLTHSVLRHHLRNLGRASENWQGQDKKVACCLALQMRHLQDNGLPDWTHTVTKRFGLETEQIMFLIDERDLTHAVAKQMMNALSEVGFAVGLRCFGSGESLIEDLQSLPLTAIFTDPDLSPRLIDDFEARMLVESTLRIADSLNATAVATGVAQKHIKEELKEIGYTRFQGKVISDALSTEGFVEWLQSKPVAEKAKNTEKAPAQSAA